MLIKVPHGQIYPNPWQTRSTLDDDYIAELAADIAANGLLQIPLGRLVDTGFNVVDPAELNRTLIDGALAAGTMLVQLSFGHNRLAAIRHLAVEQPGAWLHMPVELLPLTNQQMADMAWAENERRRDVTPMDRARAVQKRIEDFKWTQAQAAEHLGISRSAVANILRLLKLPEEIQEKLSAGDVSERQAMALLSLFDLPKDILTKARHHWNGEINPDQIVRQALAGELSSGDIRRRVQMILSAFGKDLDDAGWDLDHEFAPDGELPEGMVASACRECPERIKERNICKVPDCFRLKDTLWELEYLRRASEASGIAAADPGTNRYQATTFSDWNEEDRVARKSGCENLRLVFNHRFRKGGEDVPGFPDAEIICSKRSGHCSCVKGAKALDVVVPEEPEAEADEPGTEMPSPEELQEAARVARSDKRQANKDAKEIVQMAGRLIAQALWDGNADMWRLLARQVNWRLGQDRDEQTETIVDEVAEYMAETALPYRIETTRDALAAVNAFLSKGGLGPVSLNGQEPGGDDERFPKF